MENTLLGGGIACVLAAIVGGGFKAFGIEVPVIASNLRQLVLGVAGVALILFSQWDTRHPDTVPSQNSVDESQEKLPDFLYGTWTLRHATDEQQIDWSNSTLKFTSQERNPDGLALKGRFTWRMSGDVVGYEDFAGEYLARGRQIILEGTSVTTPQLAVGSYSAVLSANERDMKDGRWGSTMTNPAGYLGVWEATR
jgi:hypothetical protein